MRQFTESYYASIILILNLACFPVWAQQDLYLSEFQPVNLTRSARHALKAESIIVCDGKNLSVHVKVSDPKVSIEDENERTDQVRIWLALPDDAYPEGFGYQMHSKYITNPHPQLADPGPLRFFSSDQELDPQTNLKEILDQSDYPTHIPPSVDTSISLLPPKIDLEEARVPFGIVGYSFFPDNRPAEWINGQGMDLVEKALGIRMANLVDSLKYVAEMTDNESGYSLDISFSPSALGFVQLPAMNRIRILIEILNVDEQAKEADVVLASAGNSIPGIPSTFNEVNFQQALNTNVSGIPDEVFYLTNFFPTFIFTESDWTPASVDVDALVFLPRQTSESLTEVKFFRQNLNYDRDIFDGVPVETLRVQLNYVNQISREKEFTLVNNQLITTELSPYLISEPDKIRTGFFSFPDGSVGMIVKNSVPIDPFGWSNCQTCVEERISINRISTQGKQVLLEVEQGEGENAYCRIGDFAFEDFYLASIDWIKEGEVLIMGLNHQYLKEKQRVKVRWKEDGSDVEVSLMD